VPASGSALALLLAAQVLDVAHHLPPATNHPEPAIRRTGDLNPMGSHILGQIVYRRLPAAPPPPRVPSLLKLATRAYPRRQLHVVLDNYATHKHQRVQAWLARNPRVQLHFTRPMGLG
jgi:hypothetical protein